jgi:hypothetical protein
VILLEYIYIADYYVPFCFLLKGTSVASGDFNGDGKSDVIFGDPMANPVNGIGRVYVVFGTNSTTLPKLWYEETLNGNTGFIIYGVDYMDQTGSAVGSADVNGDGYLSLFNPCVVRHCSYIYFFFYIEIHIFIDKVSVCCHLLFV